MLHSSCTRIMPGSTYLQLTLLFLLGSGLGVAQTPPPRMHLQQYQEALRVGEEKNLPQAKQGTLWAQLGSAYQDAADLAKAEDAYQHALRLLRNAPSSRSDYAETLDALASLYLYSNDLEDAEKVRQQALAVREQLGDSSLIGVSQVHLADIALKRHQFKKAEQLAMRGMERMQSSPDPPRVAMLSAFICLAFARCSRNHCDQGLIDAEHAVAFVNKNFEPESPAVAFALETLGFAQWKNGGAPNGEQPMLRGIEILQRRLAPGDPRLVGAMLQYRAYLLEANRPAEAQDMQKRVISLRAQTQTSCAGCTVSVTTLANGLR